jgi:hypothetical protein
MLGESRGKAAQARAVYYIVFPGRPYRGLLNGVVRLIEQARFAAVRSINWCLHPPIGWWGRGSLNTNKPARNGPRMDKH